MRTRRLRPNDDNVVNLSTEEVRKKFSIHNPNPESEIKILDEKNVEVGSVKYGETKQFIRVVEEVDNVQVYSWKLVE